ncbi:MAG: hypothetical protein RSD35_02335 [Oscillospiraceae bacterium]
MNKKSSVFAIASLFSGAIMGSGFASGKEIFVFFSRHGDRGMAGIAAAIVGFFLFGIMLMQMSNRKSTDNIEKVICPFNRVIAQKAVGWTVTCSLFIVYAAMLAAAGAVVGAEFGMPAYIGAFCIGAVSAATVAGGIEGLSGSLKRAVPIMLCAVLAIGIHIALNNPQQSAVSPSGEISKENWFVSAMLYLSYNMTVAMPALCAAGKNCDSMGKRVLGCGGAVLALGAGAAVIHCMLMTNLQYAQNTPMPILLFANDISRGTKAVCSFMLILSIYCAASNCLYGVSKKLCLIKFTKLNSILFPTVVGCMLSFAGFSNIVRYIYPLQGAAGFLMLVLIFTSYVKQISESESKSKSKSAALYK